MPYFSQIIIFIEPRILRILYWKDKLSLGEIAKIFNVTPQAVWYQMNKFKIPRRKRPKNMIIKHNISKKTLEELYLKKKLSTEKIAKKLGVGSHSSILVKLMECGISRRTLSEIRTKYPKRSFSGNLNEKAYIMGLRAGDLSGENNHKMIRVATASTHLAQIKLVKDVFGKYTHVHTYLTKIKNNQEIRVYCDLDPSFTFLLKKSINIPNWILKNNNIFYSFLAGYMDAEGSWNFFKYGKNAIRITFRIATMDKIILEQIKCKLIELGFVAHLYLDKKSGTVSNYGKYNKDFYALWIISKKDIISLVKKLLPLSHHTEKIRKMKLIPKIRDSKWSEVKDKILDLRKEIKAERIKQS